MEVIYSACVPRDIVVYVYTYGCVYIYSGCVPRDIVGLCIHPLYITIYIVGVYRAIVVVRYGGGGGYIEV